MRENKRPSVYLEEKCAALDQVLDYLNQGSSLRPRVERLVALLVQIDFWDWEMDNLIYSFTSFAERAQAWEFENGQGLANGLKTRGFWVRFGAVKGIKSRRQWVTMHWGSASQVIAPWTALNALIEKWNQLIAACEEEVLIAREERERAASVGAHILLDLSRYRKLRVSAPNAGVKGQ